MEFKVLGPLEVRCDARTLSVPGGKPRAVLAVLLLYANQPVSAERVAVAVWGQDAPAGAARTVQVYVSRLRRALGDPEVLETSRAGYRLRVRPGELDAERFERLLEDGRLALAAGRPQAAGGLLRQALALWRGPALVDVADEPFASAEIRRLNELRLAAVEQAIDADLAAGRHREAVGELEALIAAHPLSERLHEQLMLALYRSGRQAEALETYRRARTALVEQIGVEPGPELRRLHEAVLRQDAALDAPPATGCQPSDGGDTRRTSPGALADRTLPAPPNSTIGREHDLAAVTERLRTAAVRLLTLTGPGGVGKTRLAIEAGRRLVGAFVDGVAFVGLAPLTDPRELASTIAIALDAPLREGEPPATALLRSLADRQLLLVLDNFEHLLDGAPLIAELLPNCPRLTILITSREPTRLAAERLYPVRPLELPGACGPTSPELARSAAVALFCDRASARDPDFALDAGSAPHVRAICQRLDGLPLALELAAARIGLLSPAELAARLTSALTVLTGGARDAPERQRTLRATIDWSYRLLSTDERRAFAHFAVFAGGATVTTAETVTGAALDTLDSLVAKHLIVRHDARLWMLDTVREYALERLADEPAADAVHERLATWALVALGEATPHLVREDRAACLNVLEVELPNLMTALSWALETRPADLAIRLVVALGEYWWRGNRWYDGLPWLNAALERGVAAAPEARAWALLCRARLTGVRRYERYRTDVQAALELFRARSDAPGIAACLGHRAVIEAWIGNFQQAAMTGDEAISVAEQTHDDATLAFALAERVVAAASYEDAAYHARRAVTALRRTGNLFDLEAVCSIAGYIAIRDRQYREALPWLDDAVQAASQLQDPRSVLRSRGNQGLARLFLDDLDGATQALSDALAGYRDVIGEDLIAHTILGQAAVAARRGDIAHAAQLAEAAQHHARGTPHSHERAVWSRLDTEILAPARAAADPEAWNDNARRGASLTDAEAIALARAPT